ncbi:ETS-related transcription factor Elf-4-like isoform X3 [Dendronephthya gigantea]|uniref:ETS-related transcription factor Elf-4-like isoform X3 n=1 Tax=Dendronephthya gigantea TaxID=151771 RepID=UPI00106A7C23|nr:ETS-related transcription factor Elf-4-like isoform X3 [Dendronephthya gigantea]
MAEAPKKRRNSRSAPRKSIYLWEFLFGLLEDDECSSVIAWTNKHEGFFELKNSEELAKLWGTVKNRPKMDKNKLFRAMRTYYERGMLKKVKGHKGVYQFLSIPYETEGCDQEVKGSVMSKPSPINTSINGLKSNCSERLTNDSGVAEGYCGLAAVSQMDCNHEGTIDKQEQTEGRFDKCNDRPRDESWSDYSSSSDSSTKSLDELQADLLNTDLTEMTENMDFVFNEDSDLGMYQNGNTLGW